MLRPACLILSTLALLLGLTPHRTNIATGDEAKTTTIRAEEIGKSVNVLGRLGVPLRTVLSVSGVWVELTEGPAKPGTCLWLRVQEVNGKRLDTPVEFRLFDVEVLEKEGKTLQPKIGERWSLRVYETWPDYGHPHDFLEELGRAPAAPPARGPTRLFGVVKSQ